MSDEKLNGGPEEILLQQSKFKRRLHRCLRFFHCNCRLFCIWFFISVFSCIIYALIIYFAIVGRAAYIPDPTELPFVHVPILYNFTVRIHATDVTPDRRISGFVQILFRTRVSSNTFYLHQGPNLEVNNANFYANETRVEIMLVRRGYNPQTEIHTFIVDRNFTVDQAYMVEFEFTGNVFETDSDISTRIFEYESHLGTFEYGMFHMNREHANSGLRYLLPSFDSMQYPCRFLVHIQRPISMRSMSNMQIVSLGRTSSEYFTDVYDESITLFPSQFALAVYNFANVRKRSNTTNLDIFVYFRSSVEQIISVQRLLQFMDSETNNIGKIQALVLPNITTRYQPGIAILNEQETIDEALTLQAAIDSENRTFMNS